MYIYTSLAGSRKPSSFNRHQHRLGCSNITIPHHHHHNRFRQILTLLHLSLLLITILIPFIPDLVLYFSSICRWIPDNQKTKTQESFLRSQQKVLQSEISESRHYERTEGSSSVSIQIYNPYYKC
ncbi:hypothetical protein Hanom_Chr14g01253071 [Helianthus anomalus]